MEEIENDFCRFWKEDGILHSCFKMPIKTGLEEAKQIIALRHAISNNESQYWCLDIRNLKYNTKEAQSYSETHGQEYLHATAVIVNSYILKIIVDVFNKGKRPKVPVRSFTSVESGVRWLTEMKTLNETV